MQAERQCTDRWVNRQLHKLEYLTGLHVQKGRERVRDKYSPPPPGNSARICRRRLHAVGPLYRSTYEEKEADCKKY